MYILLSFRKEMQEALQKERQEVVQSCIMIDKGDDCVSIMREGIIIIIVVQNYDIVIVYLMAGIYSHTRNVIPQFD